MLQAASQGNFFCRVQVRLRLWAVLLLRMGQRSLDEGLGKIGLEVNGLGKVEDGLFKLAHLHIDQTPVEIGLRIVRVDLDNVIEISQGPVELAQENVKTSSFIVTADKLRITL